MSENNAKLLVLTGFPAAGKDTVMNALLEKRPELSPIITHTSRPPRPGEKQGKDHYFVSEKKFMEMVDEGSILEHVKQGSYYKGTSRNEFQKVLSGSSVIWRVDLTRTANAEEFYFNNFVLSEALNLSKRTTKIILRSESYEVALNRYKNRDTEGFDENEFKVRYQRDIEFWRKHKDHYHHVIINRTGELKETVEKVSDLL